MRGHHAIDYQTPFHLVSRGRSTIGARIRNEQSANVHVLVHSRGYQCGMATEIHRVRVRSSVREKQPNHRHVTSPGGDHQRRVPPGVSFVVWCNALVAQELFHHARVAPIARESQCRVTVRLGDARIDSFVIEKQLHNITVAISCSNHKRRITVLIRYIWIQARVCEESSHNLHMSAQTGTDERGRCTSETFVGAQQDLHGFHVTSICRSH
jgi:hypothetical protein